MSERDVIYQFERDDSELISLLVIQHWKNTILTSAISDKPSSGFQAVEDLMISHSTWEGRKVSPYKFVIMTIIYIPFLHRFPISFVSIVDPKTPGTAYSNTSYGLHRFWKINGGGFVQRQVGRGGCSGPCHRAYRQVQRGRKNTRVWYKMPSCQV